MNISIEDYKEFEEGTVNVPSEVSQILDDNEKGFFYLYSLTQGDYVDRKRFIEVYESMGPFYDNHTEGDLLTALFYKVTGKFEEYNRTLSTYLSNQDTNTNYLLELEVVRCRILNGCVEDFESTLESLSQKVSFSKYILYDLFSAYLTLDHLEKAEELLVSKKNLLNELDWFNMYGMLLWYRGNLDMADSYLFKSMNESNNDPVFSLGYADFALKALGEVEYAFGIVNKFLTDSSDSNSHPRVLSLMGHIWIEKNDLDSALSCFYNAYLSEPTWFTAESYLWYLVSTKQYDEAFSAVSLFRDKGHYWSIRLSALESVLYIETGQKSKAKSIAENIRPCQEDDYYAELAMFDVSVDID